MLYGGKNRWKPEAGEKPGLYPVLHVAASLKTYLKELAQ